MSKESPLQVAPASLLDAKAVGGLEAWRGLTAQARYILAFFPRWFSDASCEGFFSERGEDVDVLFQENGRRVADHHQVKKGPQTQSSIKILVREFRTRNAAHLGSGVSRRFIIVTPSPNEAVRGAFSMLADYTPLVFISDDERKVAMAALRDRFVDGEIVDADDFEFTIERVQLMHDWGGLELTHDPRSRLAGELGQLPGFGAYGVGELTLAMEDFGRLVGSPVRRFWPREEVVTLLHDAIARRREGPPRAAGDVIFLCHQSLAPVRAHPERAVLPAHLVDARCIRHTVSHPRLHNATDWSALPDEVASIFDPAGRFQEALKLGLTWPVLYYGFPHVPLGALAGYLFGDQAQVHLVEHDREARRFAWGATTPPRDLTVMTTDRAPRGCAVARVSISASVSGDLCVPCVNEPVALEIDFRLDSPMTGVIMSELQARSFARNIRQTLDRLVSGNRDVSSLHIFAAVPVSMAFLIGQIVSATGYSKIYIYNFRLADSPPYKWALQLRRQFDSGMICFVMHEAQSSP